MVEQKKILIGDYSVMPLHNKIALNDQEFHLEPKIMEVLCYFIQHPQQVLSKQQILDELWPGQTIGHEVITRAVFELRKIFQDDAKNPQFISTITRKGYCFIHDVSLTNHAVAVEGETNSSQNIIWMCGLMLLAVTIILYFLVNQENDSNERIDATIKNVTLFSHDFEQVEDPRISPDGKTFVYVAETSNQYKLVTTTIDNFTKQELLASEQRLVSPVWLNSDTIVYAQCQRSDCRILEYDVTSGDSSPLVKQQRNVFSLDVNNHQQLLIAKMIAGKRSFAVLDLNNKTEIALNNNEMAYYPTFDISGDKIYFLALSDKGHHTLKQFDIQTNTTIQLAATFDRIFGLSAKAEGEVYVAARRAGKSGIWLLNNGSDMLTKIVAAAPGEVYSDLTFNQLANLLIYKKHKRNLDIGIQGLTQAFDGVNSDMIDMNAIYVSKYQQLIFSSNRTGFYELWSSKKGHLAKLTQLNANVIERPILTASQDKLAFTSVRLNETTLRVMKLNEGKITDSYKLPNAVHLLGWHSDSTSVFYSAAVNDGYTIFRFDLATKQSTPVLLDAGLIYQQTASKSQYYIQMSSANLMEKHNNGEVAIVTSLPELALPIRPHQVNIIDDVFYYIGRDGAQKVVKAEHFNGKTINDLLAIPANAYVTQIGKEDDVFVIYDQLINIDKQLVLTHLH